MIYYIQTLQYKLFLRLISQNQVESTQHKVLYTYELYDKYFVSLWIMSARRWFQSSCCIIQTFILLFLMTLFKFVFNCNEQRKKIRAQKRWGIIQNLFQFCMGSSSLYHFPFSNSIPKIMHFFQLFQCSMISLF